MEAYEVGEEEVQGPDPKMLQVAMMHPKNSVWNTAVVSILVEMAEKTCEARRLPERPRAYIRYLVEEKLGRVWKEWKGAQRRLTPHGLESWAEVEERLERTRIERGKVIRQRERRVKVRLRFQRVWAES